MKFSRCYQHYYYYYQIDDQLICWEYYFNLWLWVWRWTTRTL